MWRTAKKPIPETTEGMFKPQLLHVPEGPFSVWQCENEYFIADPDGHIVFGPTIAADYARMKMIEMNKNR